MTQLSDLLDEQGVTAKSYFTYAQVMQMNIDFAMAMLYARKQGLEQFTIGAFKDDTPLVGARIEREYTRSFMSSSALLCAEDGIAESSRGRTRAYLGHR